jgi:hypothetical protein
MTTIIESNEINRERNWEKTKRKDTFALGNLYSESPSERDTANLPKILSKKEGINNKQQIEDIPTILTKSMKNSTECGKTYRCRKTNPPADKILSFSFSLSGLCFSLRMTG